MWLYLLYLAILRRHVYLIRKDDWVHGFIRWVLPGVVAIYGPTKLGSAEVLNVMAIRDIEDVMTDAYYHAGKVFEHLYDTPAPSPPDDPDDPAGVRT